MRALSQRQAVRCETALHKTCRCRCKGALHGLMRHVIDEDGQEDPAFFEELPEDDPHHVRSEAEKWRRRKIRRQQAKAPLQARLWEELTD